MTDVDVQAGIEYRQGMVQEFRSYDVYVADDAAERRLCAYMIKDLGWHLQNRTPEGAGWLLHFTHWSLVADTDRGDVMRVDRRGG